MEIHRSRGHKKERDSKLHPPSMQLLRLVWLPGSHTEVGALAGVGGGGGWLTLPD